MSELATAGNKASQSFDKLGYSEGRECPFDNEGGSTSDDESDQEDTGN